MSTPIKVPTDAQVRAWVSANPQATPEEIRDYMDGLPPSPSRLGVEGRLGSAVAAGRAAAQTASFGLEDELVGGLTGAVKGLVSGQGIQQGIRHGIADERAINKELAARHPLATVGGSIAGAFVPVAGTTAALTRAEAVGRLLGTGLKARMLGGAAAGAVGGGATAFGMAEGNPLERVPAALIGGTLGAATGAALPLAGTGFRVAGGAMGIRGGKATEQAANAVNKALERDKTSPADIAARAAENPTVPQTMAELSGEHAMGLAVGARNESQQARQTARDALLNRMDQEHQRYDARLKEVLNPEDRDVAATLKELKTLREEHALKNYDDALMTQKISDPQTASLFNEKEVKRAYLEYAANQETLKAQGKSYDEVPPLYMVQLGAGGQKSARLAKATAIPLKAIQVARRALGQAIQGGFSNGKQITTDRARTLMSAMDAMDKRLETQVPEFGRANAVYRDDSSLMDNLQAGRGLKLKSNYGRTIPNFKSAPSDQVESHIAQLRGTIDKGGNAADLAEQQLEHYKLGAYAALKQEVAKKGNPTNWLSVPNNRRKVLALFDGDRAKATEFERALRLEKEIRPSAKIGNAQMSQEQPSTAALDILLGSMAVAQGRVYPAMAAGGRLLRGSAGLSQPAADEAMKYLMAGASNMNELLGRLDLLKRASETQKNRMAGKLGRTAAYTGGLTGAAMQIGQ